MIDICLYLIKEDANQKNLEEKEQEVDFQRHTDNQLYKSTIII